MNRNAAQHVEDAGDIFWPRQSHERSVTKYLYGGVAADWKDYSKAQGCRRHLRPLVCTGDGRNRNGQTSHHPRLRRVSGELFEVEYPAPGDPELAIQIRELLKPINVKLDHNWGLDHGAWSVLTHAFPQADVPIVQISIDKMKPPAFHYEIGKRLAPLRDEQVLIIGSGNLVHNLHAYAWGRHAIEPFDWAMRFEKQVRNLLSSAEDGPLINYEKLGPEAAVSVPTPDHYLPLLYVIALRKEGEPLTFPVEGIDGGSVSMLTIQIRLIYHLIHLTRSTDFSLSWRES